jgi:hypothetical protein
MGVRRRSFPLSSTFLPIPHNSTSLRFTAGSLEAARGCGRDCTAGYCAREHSSIHGRQTGAGSAIDSPPADWSFSAPRCGVWTRPESWQSPPRAGLGRFWGQEGTLIYPKQNTRLTEQIVTLGGVLILEFPMSTLAAPQNISHSHHQWYFHRRMMPNTAAPDCLTPCPGTGL